MAITWNIRSNTPCLNACWYRITPTRPCGQLPCPLPLFIFVNSTDQVAVNFAGRGKRGFGCPGVDTYITNPNRGQTLIDVWRAYGNGIWVSSVVIQVYASLAAGSQSADVSLSVRVDITPNAACPNRGGFPVVPTIRGEVCPTRQIATVTVFDDGTYTCVMQ